MFTTILHFQSVQGVIQNQGKPSVALQVTASRQLGHQVTAVAGALDVGGWGCQGTLRSR